MYWEIVPFSHYGGSIKRVGQYKSRVLFSRVTSIRVNGKFKIKLSFLELFIRELNARLKSQVTNSTI